MCYGQCMPKRAKNCCTTMINVDDNLLLQIVSRQETVATACSNLDITHYINIDEVFSKGQTKPISLFYRTLLSSQMPQITKLYETDNSFDRTKPQRPLLSARRSFHCNQIASLEQASEMFQCSTVGLKSAYLLGTWRIKKSVYTIQRNKSGMQSKAQMVPVIDLCRRC